jgi:hypothetical protein
MIKHSLYYLVTCQSKGESLVLVPHTNKAYAAPSARRAGFRSSSLEVGVSETPEPFSTTAIEDS